MEGIGGLSIAAGNAWVYRWRMGQKRLGIAMKVALLGIAVLVLGVSGGVTAAHLIPPASAREVAPTPVASIAATLPAVDCSNPFIAAAKPDGWVCEG